MPRSSKFLIGIIFILPLLLWGGVRVYKSEVFGINCTGHLGRAAMANSVEIANDELKIAIADLEREHLTSGNTGILYQTPPEDIGFWYKNLKSAQNELETLPPQSTAMERTNILMKLRESLVVHGESGESIICPDGISIYPYNTGYLFWCIFGIGFAALGALMLFSAVTDTSTRNRRREIQA